MILAWNSREALLSSFQDVQLLNTCPSALLITPSVLGASHAPGEPSIPLQSLTPSPQRAVTPNQEICLRPS